MTFIVEKYAKRKRCLYNGSHLCLGLVVIGNPSLQNLPVRLIINIQDPHGWSICVLVNTVMFIILFFFMLLYQTQTVAYRMNATNVSLSYCDVNVL